MECISPGGRVSRNSFALVVCNEPVGEQEQTAGSAQACPAGVHQ